MPKSIKHAGARSGTVDRMDAKTLTAEATNPSHDEDCWFCNDALRADPPPGGWLLDDGTWRVGHAPAGMAAAGTLVLEARRHVLDQAGFDNRESGTFVPVLGAVVTAMRRALGCERVYQWSTMAAYPHFHVWLVPWWAGSAHEGPAHLAAMVESPGSEEEVAAAAGQVAAALGATS